MILGWIASLSRRQHPVVSSPLLSATLHLVCNNKCWYLRMIGCNSLLFNHCLPLIQDLRIKSCKFVFPQKFAKRCIQAEMIANSGKNLQGGSDRSKKKFDLWFDQLWKIIIQNLYSLSAIICKKFHFLHSPLFYSSDDKQIIQFLSLIIGGSFLANKEPQLCICICS